MTWQNGLQFDSSGNLLTSGAAGTNPFSATTAAETTAGVTPVNTAYPENDIRRYASSFGTNDTTAWNNCRAVATVNQRPMLLAGLTLKFPAGIAWDYAAHGIEGQNAILDFTALSTGPALTADTQLTSAVTAYADGGFSEFSMSGPGNGGTVDAIQFGTTGLPHQGPFALIDHFFIKTFRRGLTWGAQSYAQSINNGVINNCLWGIYLPAGIAVSGENILLKNVHVSNNTNGIYCNAGYLNIDGSSLDYNTNQAVWCQAAGVVRMHNFHIESNTDNAVWIECDDALSEIYLDAGTIAYTGAGKTTNPVGNCTNAGSAQINLGDILLVGFTEANYGFNYLINGHGTCRSLGWQSGGNGAGAPACVPFSGNSLLLDGGFEGSTVVDWNSIGNGCQAVISSTQHYAGSKSMAQAPTAAQTASEQLYFVIQPGVNVQFACRLIKDGTASTDVATIALTFFDQNKNSIASNAVSRVISSLPTSWTRYVTEPFGQAPPGARWCLVSIGKSASGGGGSDGNGTIYWDDCYLSVTGGMGRTMAVGEELAIASLAVGSAGSRTSYKGWALTGIHVQNTTANAVTGGLKIGTSVGGTDVCNGIAVAANAEFFIPVTGTAITGIAIPLIKSTGRQVFFVDAVTGWNSASLNMTWYFKKAVSQGY